ncbi:MAG: hypothetical protein Q8868_03425 [Bacteroidota bacterium]|nr:hypothetical protein [Bacteroidota bacterium]
MKKLYKKFSIISATSLILAITGTATTYSIFPSDTLSAGSLMKIDSFRIAVVPPSSGVQFYRNGIVFLSSSKTEGRIPESFTSFGRVEAYYAVCTDTSIGAHIVFSPSSTFEVPCEAMTFNNDYSVMYYSKRPSNRAAEKIYQANFRLIRNGRRDWISSPKPLTFCSGSSTYSHPSLSADGEKMIFASNMAGSLGGLDLYITKKDGDDWSEPVNLGNLINTAGNESYPFLDQDNNLYFSSDGFEGSGGYDVYVCRYTGDGWGKPANITRFINSPDDEIAFTLSRLDGRSAFFTRRLKTGNKPAFLFRISLQDKLSQKSITDLSEALTYIAKAESTPLVPSSPVAAKQAEANVPDKELAQVFTTKQPEPVKKETTKSVERSTKKPEPVKPQAQAETKSQPVVTKSSQTTEKPPQTQTKPQQTTEKPPQTSVNPKQTDAKPQPAEQKPPVQTASPASAGPVIYRVQFAASMKPKGSYEVTVSGKTYKTYEYLYNGGYRSCAGEFTTLNPAINLQKALKQAGYPDAFVVAFRNNARTNDPSLFK